MLRSGLGWSARLWAGGGQRLLDRIDAGLVSGAIRARLPDLNHKPHFGTEAGRDLLERLGREKLFRKKD